MESRTAGTFIERTQFIDRTGIFVSPIMYDMIKKEYVDQKLSEEEFLKKWKADNENSIIELSIDDGIHCLFTDYDLTGLDRLEINCEERRAVDIIDDLLVENWKLQQESEKMAEVLKKSQEAVKKATGAYQSMLEIVAEKINSINTHCE